MNRSQQEIGDKKNKHFRIESIAAKMQIYKEYIEKRLEEFEVCQ